jgi:hypothetical protein
MARRFCETNLSNEDRLEKKMDNHVVETKDNDDHQDKIYNRQDMIND